MANGTIAFDTLSTSGQITGTAKSLDTDYVVNGSAKAWINFDGTASGAAARGSFNLASMTDTSTGVYVCNLTNAFANTNDCAATSSASASTSGSDNRNISTTITSASAIDSRVSNAASGAVLDTSINYVSAFGDLA